MKVQGNRYINNPEMIKNKVEKPAIDIFKASRGRNTPKSNTDVAWSGK